MPEPGIQKLYTPDVLALAVSLAGFPLTADFTVRGKARSRACGSTLELGLACDSMGRIAHIGLAVNACAIGQAAAALFAAGATGQSRATVAQALAQIEHWLSGEGDAPVWPGIERLAQARAYPARHGAILLPWKAAQAALGNSCCAG